MRLKIKIRTIKGKAEGVEKKIRPFILGLRKPKIHTVEINKENDTILWTVEDDVRKITKIHYNVIRFDNIMQKVLGSKMLKKKVKPGQLEELEDLLRNHTSVEVVK